MNINDEVQLAIEMNIENVREFIIKCKMNYWYRIDDWHEFDFFNGRLVEISLMPFCDAFKWGVWFVIPFADKKTWNNFIYDPGLEKFISKKYDTDESFRLRHDYKRIKRSYDKLKQACVFEENILARSLIYDQVVELKEKMDKIDKRLKFIKRREEIIKSGGTIDTSKDFDITYLKTIPIDLFVDVNRAGFFRVREGDKTPSCKWFKNENTWVDFGGDNQRHDVIDLIMITKTLDFIGACRFLSMS